MSDSTDPVPRLSAPPASSGLLDGFSFFFTETDNFGCPVVTDDVSSPLSDTISHAVPDSFPGTLEGITSDSLSFTETDPLKPTEHDAPRPGQSVFAHPGSGMTLSFAGYRRIPTPSLVRQSHPSPVSPQSHDGISIPHSSIPSLGPQGFHGPGYSPPAAPMFGSSHLPRCHHRRWYPFQFSTLLPFYRDSEGDSCTLTSATYHDAIPQFSSNHIIRLSLAATHFADARPSTICSNTDPPEHHPKHASRYLPPAHIIAGLTRDQARNVENSPLRSRKRVSAMEVHSSKQPLFPVSPPIAFMSSSTMIHLEASTCFVLASKCLPLVPTVRT